MTKFVLEKNKTHVKRTVKKDEDGFLRGNVDVADFTAMGFVGFDVNSTVGIP